jgi:hypothetical protein
MGYLPLVFPSDVNPYAREFDELAARVDAGETLSADAERSILRPLAIAQAAYASARTGRFVTVTDCLDEDGHSPTGSGQSRAFR